MKIRELVLVGGGGHCRSCIEIIQSTGQYKIVGIIEKEKKTSLVLDIPVIGDDTTIPLLIKEKKYHFVITLGQIKSSTGRRTLFDYVNKNGGETPTVISSSALISKYAKIDIATIIMHNAFINANSLIGKACIINTGAIIEHDAIIGDFCHVSTQAVVNGGVEIGSDCFIGSGTTINHNVSICNDCIIGAGTVVTHSINNSGIYVGNPARKIVSYG